MRHFVRRPKRRPPIINRGTSLDQNHSPPLLVLLWSTHARPCVSRSGLQFAQLAVCVHDCRGRLCAGYYSRIAALRGLLAQFLRATATSAAAEANSARATAVPRAAACGHFLFGQDPQQQCRSGRPAAAAEDPISGTAPSDPPLGAAPSAPSALTGDRRQQTASGTRDGQSESQAGSGHDPVSETGTSGSATAGGVPQSLRPAGDGASGREPVIRQVLSLGAGFDTTWFHYKVRCSEHDGWALMQGAGVGITIHECTHCISVLCEREPSAFVIVAVEFDSLCSMRNL